MQTTAYVHEWLGISLEAWLTIAAIFLGPITALFAQNRYEKRRASTDRKIRIFRALMANRASRLAPGFVEALNGIETEFYGNIKVIESWRSLVDHYNTPHDPEDKTFARWNEKLSDLLTNMLYEMAESLGYHFDKVTLKKSAYYPTGWGMIEEEQTRLRQAAMRVFEGDRTLKVEVFESGQEPEQPLAPRKPTH